MTDRQNLRRSSVRLLPMVIAWSMAFFGCFSSHAQSAATLAQVRKIYVEPFSGKRGAQEVRNEVVDRLRRDPALTIVANAAQSDAVLKGTGEIWTSGYIATNPRASGSSRNPIYSGYLSLTLEGGNAQPLWSYLVTPAGAFSGSITSNLAGHAATLLVTAMAHEKASGGGAAPSVNPDVSGQTSKQTLKGAGATFPAPLYQEWIQYYHQLHPETRISYDAVGSDEGVQRLLDGKVDFAASDVPTLLSGGPLQRFATVLGAVVPIYNLRGLDRELRFTPQILAGIYLGKITHWDAPEIRTVNRGVSLPNAAIVVVHRSDGSGSTYAFTDFLSRTCPDWKSAVGTGSTVQWPVGVGAARNDGVASQVEQTPNSIGYVELTYAVQHELSFGAVRNAAGVFVTANLDSVAAAAQSAVIVAGEAPSIVNAPGKAAYPISSFTWILLPETIPGGDRSTIAEMLQWMLTSGQKQSSALGYAPLPREVASRELQSLAQLK
jgi:phosphate transport system substrate-binding protein